MKQEFLCRLSTKQLEGRSVGVASSTRNVLDIESLPARRPSSMTAFSQARMLHSTQPSFGMFDTFKQSWGSMKESTMEQKKQEVFSAQVLAFLACVPYM
jgi:hypothetical protein